MAANGGSKVDGELLTNCGQYFCFINSVLVVVAQLLGAIGNFIALLKNLSKYFECVEKLFALIKFAALSHVALNLIVSKYCIYRSYVYT